MTRTELKEKGSWPMALVDNAGLRVLEPGFHCDTHLHHTVELVVVQEGSLTMTVQDTPVHLEQGEFLVIFPNVLHSADVSKEEHCEAIQLHIHCAARPDLAAEENLGGEDTFLLELALEKRRWLKGTSPEQLTACARGTLEEFTQRGEGSDQMLACYVRQLIVLLSRQMNQHSETPLCRNRYLLQATLFISRHCSEKLTVARVAGEVGVSARYLTRLFREQLGMGVAAYITNVRVSRSIDYMFQNPGYPMAKLAIEMGFSSQQHFSRVFREKMGVPPGRYFSRLTKGNI